MHICYSAFVCSFISLVTYVKTREIRILHLSKNEHLDAFYNDFYEIVWDIKFHRIENTHFL